MFKWILFRFILFETGWFSAIIHLLHIVYANRMVAFLWWYITCMFACLRSKARLRQWWGLRIFLYPAVDFLYVLHKVRKYAKFIDEIYFTLVTVVSIFTSSSWKICIFDIVMNRQKRKSHQSIGMSLNGNLSMTMFS